MHRLPRGRVARVEPGQVGVGRREPLVRLRLHRGDELLQAGAHRSSSATRATAWATADATSGWKTLGMMKLELSSPSATHPAIASPPR